MINKKISGIEDLNARSMYEEMDEQANEWAKLFRFALNTTIPCLVLPYFILTLFSHFSGETDVYLLAYPIW